MTTRIRTVSRRQVQRDRTATARAEILRGAAGVLATRRQRPLQECDAMGFLDDDGIDRFNFPQTIWLYPNVRMRATRRFTRAAEVLSVNLLSLALTDREPRYLERLARPFYEDCLADLTSDEWCIPLETIREWILHTQRANAKLNARKARGSHVDGPS